MNKRGSALRGELHRARGAAYDEVLRTPDAMRRDRALERAQAAQLVALGVLGLKRVTNDVAQRITADVNITYDEINTRYADLIDQQEAIGDPTDPAYWAGMVLTSEGSID